MPDEFDEKAEKIMDDKHRTISEIRGRIAQALRDMQRETAEECIRLIDEGGMDTGWTCDAIRDRFGLKN